MAILLHEAELEKKWDVRLKDRALAKGSMTLEDWEKHSKQLPDESEQGVPVTWETLSLQDSRAAGASRVKSTT